MLEDVLVDGAVDLVIDVAACSHGSNTAGVVDDVGNDDAGGDVGGGAGVHELIPNDVIVALRASAN